MCTLPSSDITLHVFTIFAKNGSTRPSMWLCCKSRVRSFVRYPSAPQGKEPVSLLCDTCERV